MTSRKKSQRELSTALSRGGSFISAAPPMPHRRQISTGIETCQCDCTCAMFHSTDRQGETPNEIIKGVLAAALALLPVKAMAEDTIKIGLFNRDAAIIAAEN